jgi:hypothetical protein
MNKKGTAIFFLLMMGVVFFLMGLALAPALKDITDEARGSSGLDCDAEGISDQDKAVCTSVDIQQNLFIGSIFGLAGLLIGRIGLG